MQTLFLTGSLLLAALLLLDSPQPATAVCCPPWNPVLCTTFPPTHVYCSVGDCNVFGCNCDGGCAPSRFDPKRSVEGKDEVPVGESIIAKGDKDSDGILNYSEAVALLKVGGVEATIEKVAELDINKDGHLTAHEIDPK